MYINSIKQYFFYSKQLTGSLPLALLNFPADDSFQLYSTRGTVYITRHLLSLSEKRLYIVSYQK